MDAAQNDIFLKLLTSRKYRLARHVTLIVLLAAGIYNSKAVFVGQADVYAKVFLLSVLLSLFYINMYSLVPKLLFKGNYLGYFLWISGLFILVLLIAYETRHVVFAHIKPLYKEADDRPNLFAAGFMFVILVGASAAVKLFQRWILATKRINELETTTIQSELEQLKNQINPHFLFNTLNNVNVLTRQDPEKASQLLMKLSDLLRYQLYDSVRELVFLSADIHFLEDFLNLEKVRRDAFEFTVSTEGDLNAVQVPPLLFITFVENAVKHNLDAENPSFVNLSFLVADGQLCFQCINSKPTVAVTAQTKGGLGLANVKRRLALIYPGKHKLDIQDHAMRFEVLLTIPL